MKWNYLRFDAIPDIPEKRAAQSLIYTRLNNSKRFQRTVVGIGLAAGLTSGVLSLEHEDYVVIPEVIAATTVVAAFVDKRITDRNNGKVISIFGRPYGSDATADATSPRTLTITDNDIKENRTYDSSASTEYIEGITPATLHGFTPVEAYISGKYMIKAVIDKVANNGDRFPVDTSIASVGLVFGAGLVCINEYTNRKLETSYERQIDNIQGNLTIKPPDTTE